VSIVGKKYDFVEYLVTSPDSFSLAFISATIYYLPMPIKQVSE
jgi:hypothetical protein